MTSSRAADRRGKALRRGAAAMITVGVVVASLWMVLPKLSLSFTQTGPTVFAVQRAEFIHDIAERGNLESASNVEIRCQVQTHIGGGGARSSGGGIYFYPTFTGVRVRRTSGTRPVGAGGVSVSSGASGGGASSSSRLSMGGSGSSRFSTGRSSGRSSMGGGMYYRSSGTYGLGGYSGMSGRSGFGGGSGGGTMIVELIDEGTYVQPGDVLCRLDSSSLEDQLVQQEIICNYSEADVIRARNSYESTLIAKQEWLEGQYVQDKQVIESDIFVAEENLRRAQQYLEYNKQLLNRDYITSVQVEREEFNVQRARKQVAAAKIDLMVLEDYAKVMALKQLDADIKMAETALRSQERSHQLDQEKLALIQKQIENCTIRAPEPGQVVYVNQTEHFSEREVIIEEGEMVRERQALFRLPDPKRMLVRAKIDEARIGLVRSGMRVSIRLDAFPDKPLAGVVEKVSEYPVASSFFSSSSAKEYETMIKIEDAPEGLRPGLTAEVKVRVRQVPDVLQVPVQAIFQHQGRNYCILHEHEEDWRLREVKLGVTNDKVVVIEEGLQEGDQVVVGAARYRDRVDLPVTPPTLADPRPVANRAQTAESET